MNKKSRLIGPFLILLFFIGGEARADTPFMKFNRGLVNILTAPLEYGVQFLDFAQDGGLVNGLFGGLFYGTTMTVARELSGVYDIVTFPVPLPRGYAPWVEPDTPLEAIQNYYPSPYDR